MEHLEPPNLETRLRRRKKQRAGRALLKYALVAASFTFVGDYTDVNSRALNIAHTAVGIRDAPYSANPFDYRVTFEHLPDRQRQAYVTNILTGERHELYSNGKTEADNGIIDAFVRKVEEGYSWLKQSKVGQGVADLKQRVTDALERKEE